MIPGMLQKIKAAVAPPPFVPFAPQAITAPAIEILGRGFDVYDFIHARRQTKQLEDLKTAVGAGGLPSVATGQPNQARKGVEGTIDAAK